MGARHSAYHAEEVPSMTIEKRRSKVPTVVAEQELALAHLGVALFGLVDGLRTDAGKAKREFSESRAQTVHVMSGVYADGLPPQSYGPRVSRDRLCAAVCTECSSGRRARAWMMCPAGRWDVRQESHATSRSVPGEPSGGAHTVELCALAS